jgi:hypothetical protein
MASPKLAQMYEVCAIVYATMWPLRKEHVLS